MALSPYLLKLREAKLAGTRPEAAKKLIKLNHGQWFEEQLKQSPGKCEICNDDLASSMLINPRSVVAHILAKVKFPSVATASLNRFFACNSCHATYDSASSEEIKELELYPTLVERLKTFYNLITEAEKGKLPACFRLDSVVLLTDGGEVEGSHIVLAENI